MHCAGTALAVHEPEQAVARLACTSLEADVAEVHPKNKRLCVCISADRCAGTRCSDALEQVDGHCMGVRWTAMKPCVGFVWVRGGADVSDRVGEGDVGCEGPKVDTFQLVARARRTVGCLGHRACFVRCAPWVPAIFGESRAPRGGRRGRRRPWHGYASTSLNFLKML